MGAGLFFFYLVSGLISGGICAWVAKEKGRSGINWFLLGFLFNFFAIIALAAVPSNQKNTTNENKQNQLHSNAVFNDYTGDRDIAIDAYKLYLTRKYKLEKNDVLSAYVFEEKIFKTLDEALLFLHQEDESTQHRTQLAQERVNETNNLANQDRDVRKGVIISTLIIVIIIIFLVGTSNKGKDDFPNGNVKEGGSCTKTSECWLHGSRCENGICTTSITPKGKN